jgi:hypothetical protein
MVKVFALLFSALMAVASVGGYVYLDAKIITGEIQISEGQTKVDDGQSALDKGKAKLNAGKLALAEGKAEYETAHDNLFMLSMDKLFNNGNGFEHGRKNIAEGIKHVAQGEARISAETKRLAAGELELHQGKEQLKLARGIRISCALGAIFFGVLSIALTILWRRSLTLFFKRITPWFSHQLN